MKVVYNINEKDKNKIRIAAYMRYSSDNQSENSIEYQRDAIDKYIARLGYIKVAEYIDEAYSGTSDQRPGFQEMMKDAKHKPSWSKVIVYDSSRFSRNLAHAIGYLHHLKDNGLSFESVTENFGEGIMSKFTYHIYGAVNELYSDRLSESTFAGLKNKARSALTCGGIPPLGYDLDDDGKLIINPEEAKCVRLIFDLYENNWSYKRIYDKLNSEGYKTKLGNKFSKNSFYSILTQEKYTGKYIWNKIDRKSSKGIYNSHKYKPLSERIIVEDEVPVIIPKEQFDRVQDMIHRRQHGAAQCKSRHFYLLSSLGKLKCAECGATLIGTARKSHGHEYTYYYCPNKKIHKCNTKEIRADYLDYFVVNYLLYYIYSNVNVIEIYNNINEHKRITELKNKVLGLEKSKKNIIMALRNSYKECLLSELDNIAKEIQIAQKEIDVLTNSKALLSNKQRKQLCKELRKMILHTENYEVKKYISQMIDEIIVSNDNIDIQLNIA